MNKSLENRKRRGEWVELQFMARAASHGFTVSKPWGDSARYDFVVESGAGVFHRVQVKGTTFQNRSNGCSPNGYQCRVSSTSSDGTSREYRASEIDFFACFIIPLDVWYILPISELSLSHSSVLLDPGRFSNRYAKFLEAWHLLK
jgi:hypothetical protein